MKLKLDENLDPRSRSILTRAGHDVSTAREEGLSGFPDSLVADAIVAEGRCLVTLDLGFANVLAFPPDRYPGIVVLRHHAPTANGVLGLVSQLSQVLRSDDPAGKLWILEPGRLRVHEPMNDSS